VKCALAVPLAGAALAVFSLRLDAVRGEVALSSNH
jgi:MFS transporter, AAHS family, 4-hydroxybenzoate transporter